MKVLKLVFCSFAAVWLPVSVLSGIFGLENLNGVLSRLGEWPLYVVIVGLILMLVDLWQSPKPQDDKIWWTVLGVIIAPLVVPAYWFGVGLRRNMGRADSQSIDSGSSESR